VAVFATFTGLALTGIADFGDRFAAVVEQRRLPLRSESCSALGFRTRERGLVAS
jgi:hypothetical protein